MSEGEVTFTAGDLDWGDESSERRRGTEMHTKYPKSNNTVKS